MTFLSIMILGWLAAFVFTTTIYLFENEGWANPSPNDIFFFLIFVVIWPLGVAIPIWLLIAAIHNSNWWYRPLGKKK